MKRIIFFLSILAAVNLMHAQEFKLQTSDGVNLYVNVKGSGTPCLYIHGGPGSGSFWMEEFMGTFLEQHFQMIYLDQRGVGRSSSPADQNYAMERMVQDFEEVRMFLGIKQWITLGHSFAGVMQMAYVNSKPEAINGMIFLNCTLSLHDSFENSWLPKAIELLHDEVPELALDPTKSVYERMLAIMPALNEKNSMWKLFFAAQENSWKMNDTYNGFDAWNSDQSEQILDFKEYWNDYLPLTKNIKKPVLFYYGTTDWAIGPEHYKGVKFPKMMLWRSEAGHMPFLENKEDLEKAITVFIKKYIPESNENN